jgi:hypothetical protein
MNLWRKVEQIVKPWMLVVLFIIMFVLGLSNESKAESVATVEIGPTLLSGQFSKGVGLMVNQTWDNKWRLGMGVTTEQSVVPRKEALTEVRQNLWIHGQRVVSITEKLDLGLGMAYFNAKTRWNGSNVVASLSIEYNFTDRWSASFRHYSNAGSASPNMGQDLLVIGYTFQ